MKNEKYESMPLFLVKAICEMDEYMQTDNWVNDKLNCLLVDYKNEKVFSMLKDETDSLIYFNYENDQKPDITTSYDWDFSFDNTIFYYLEKGYNIKSINLETHFGIWCFIKEYYPEDIQYKNGLNKYIKFCKNYNITKDYLDNALKMNTPDIMKMINIKERER